MKLMKVSELFSPETVLSNCGDGDDDVDDEDEDEEEEEDDDNENLLVV